MQATKSAVAVQNPTHFLTLGLALSLALGALLAGCSPKEPPAPTAAAAPAAAEAPASDPVAGQVEASLALTPEAMEALLAPIALYPDPVLAQVLTASTNPQMVLDAGNWLIANPDLKGRALDEAAQPLGFSPSMRALLQFPEVVDMLCMQLDWTTQLGEAFAADQAGVLDAVQRLRKQSADVGNLKTSDQMKVNTEVQDGKEVITVEPADPKVVYVPKYDPVAVYAPPPAVIPAPTTTTTVVQEKTGYSTGAMVTTGLLSFGAGLLVAEIFDDDDDWDDYRPNYGYGGMYYGGRPYYPPPPGYYRPPYGGSYRPGYGYNRPPGYQNGFNNNTIIVNNQGNDYWNSYGNRPGSNRPGAGGNQSGRPGSPISTARPNRPEMQALDQQQRTRQAEARSRPRPVSTDKSAGWQGQNSYVGAKNKATGAKPAQQAGRPSSIPTTGKVQGGYAGARPEGQAARDKMVAGRPELPGTTGNASRERPKSSGSADRGYGDSGRPTRQAGQQQTSRQSQQKQPTRPAQSRPAPRPSADRSGASRSGGSSFGGASQGGNDRAASQRGRQSMPEGARSKGGSANRGGGNKSRR